MKARFILISIIGVFFLVSSGTFQTSAVANWVSFPSAYNAIGSPISTWGVLYYGGAYAQMQDSFNDQFIQTYDYTNPDYDPEYWMQPLPPSNATITQIAMLAVLRTDVSERHIKLEYSLDLVNWIHPVWQTVVAPYPGIYYQDITTDRNWTPTILESSDFGVKLSTTDHTTNILYVDYIGISYRWEPFNGTGEGGGTPSYFDDNLTLPISIPGAFGTIGFIGLTVCPAYAIMQWRQGGDGRVARLLMSIVAMLVFFTLFLASLGA